MLYGGRKYFESGRIFVVDTKILSGFVEARNLVLETGEIHVQEEKIVLSLMDGTAAGRQVRRLQHARVRGARAMGPPPRAAVACRAN